MGSMKLVEDYLLAKLVSILNVQLFTVFKKGVLFWGVVCPFPASLIAYTICLSTGECKCDNGYGGEDCSIDLSSPLNINFRGRTQYVCDQSRRACIKTPVNGKNFVESSKLMCKVTMTLIMQVISAFIQV